MLRSPLCISILAVASGCTSAEPTTTPDTADTNDTNHTNDTNDTQTTPEAPAPFTAIERDIDRAGFDYNAFDLDESDPNACMWACLADPQCLAFSYTEPGFFEAGGPASCFLKNAVAHRSSVEGVWSGVVRAGIESGMYRKGKPVVGGLQKTQDAAGCRAACILNEACAAWVLSPPVFSSINCVLMDDQSGPPQVGTTSTASGLVRDRGLEYGTDRLGSDIESLMLDDPSPQACRASCIDNPACLAFTYVQPAGEGEPAACFHKGSPVPSPTPLDTAIAGVLER